MEEKNNKEKIAEESVQSNENTVAEEANNKELEINKEEISNVYIKLSNNKTRKNCKKKFLWTIKPMRVITNSQIVQKQAKK